jgi:hypothetical protein
LKENPTADSVMVQQVKESYEICLKHPNFFRVFYDTFTKKDQRVADLFENTDFERQAKALRASLAYLIMFAEGSDRRN